MMFLPLPSPEGTEKSIQSSFIPEVHVNKIEEIAKAAYDRRFGHTTNKWGGLTAEEKDPYLLDASAFLHAIRKPNHAMLKAGSAAMKEKNWPIPTGYIEEIWSNMVHAALE